MLRRLVHIQSPLYTSPSTTLVHTVRIVSVDACASKVRHSIPTDLNDIAQRSVSRLALQVDKERRDFEELVRKMGHHRCEESKRIAKAVSAMCLEKDIALFNRATTSFPRALLRPDYKPLSTAHAVFHQPQADVTKQFRNNTQHPSKMKEALLKRRREISTVHPAFGTPPKSVSMELLHGPVYISGFFLSIDPTAVFDVRGLTPGPQNRPVSFMNPNVQLTIRDKDGRLCRTRYRCIIESSRGLRAELLLRTQVGWISPHAVFTAIPPVVHLGKGFDFAIPFVCHFTMINILDEDGHPTGSCLYFSGTPWLGLSAGFSRISGGRLTLNPTRDIDPAQESSHFFGRNEKHRVHYRQMGFLFLKGCSWLACLILCLPQLDVWNRSRRAVRHKILFGTFQTPDNCQPFDVASLVLWKRAILRLIGDVPPVAVLTAPNSEQHEVTSDESAAWFFASRSSAESSAHVEQVVSPKVADGAENPSVLSTAALGEWVGWVGSLPRRLWARDHTGSS